MSFPLEYVGSVKVEKIREHSDRVLEDQRAFLYISLEVQSRRTYICCVLDIFWMLHRTCPIELPFELSFKGRYVVLENKFTHRILILTILIR